MYKNQKIKFFPAFLIFEVPIKVFLKIQLNGICKLINDKLDKFY